MYVPCKFAASFLARGPLTYDATEPPEILPVTVPDKVNKLVELVINIPLVNVSVPEMVLGACKVTPDELVLLIVKLDGPFVAGKITSFVVCEDVPANSSVDPDEA